MKNGKMEIEIENDNDNEQEEIKEFISTLILLSKEDRAILLSNANALKVRSDIEKTKKVGV